MTLKETKIISLKIWRYLAAHPEIERKEYLPARLIKKAEKFVNKCPVCEYIVKVRNRRSCEGCPILDKKGVCYLYTKWHWSKSEKARQKWAQKIVAAVEQWEEL